MKHQADMILQDVQKFFTKTFNTIAEKLLQDKIFGGTILFLTGPLTPVQTLG